jgi:hypothetical protein
MVNKAPEEGQLSRSASRRGTPSRPVECVCTNDFLPFHYEGKARQHTARRLCTRRRQ